MDDPNIILLVDPRADRPAEQPVIGSGFGHSGSTTKRGACTLAPCAFRLVLQQGLADAEAAMPAISMAPDTNLLVS